MNAIRFSHTSTGCEAAQAKTLASEAFLAQQPHSQNASRPLSQAHSPTLRGALAALDRAFAAAQRVAAQTNTSLIVQQNGKLVHMKVK